MFLNRSRDTSQIELKMLLNKLHDLMADESITIEEFAALNAQYEKLYKLREVDVKVNSTKHVSRDVLATIAANLLGIVLIVGHERAHVLTSKALPLIKKLF